MKRPYFVSAPVDWALMGGISVAAYAAAKVLGGAAQERTWGVLTLWSYSFLINGFHFAATNYRLYRSRDAMLQYPMTAAAVPVVVLAGAAAALSRPDSIAPCFVKLFLLWSPYHYSGQSLGVSLAYAGRAGVQPDGRQRTALAACIYGSFLTVVCRGEAVAGSYFGMALPSLGLPAWLWKLALAGTLVSAAAFFFLTARGGRRWPAIALLPPIAQFFWFVPGFSVASYFQLVPMFHGLQYLLIAWFMQAQLEKTPDSSLSGITARWTAGNAAGYLLLFWAIPKSLSLLTGQAIMVAGPVAVAAVQLHHFFVDGVIWRLRDKRVGAPLMAELA